MVWLKHTNSIILCMEFCLLCIVLSFKALYSTRKRLLSSDVLAKIEEDLACILVL